MGLGECDSSFFPVLVTHYNKGILGICKIRFNLFDSNRLHKPSILPQTHSLSDGVQSNHRLQTLAHGRNQTEEFQRDVHWQSINLLVAEILSICWDSHRRWCVGMEWLDWSLSLIPLALLGSGMSSSERRKQQSGKWHQVVGWPSSPIHETDVQLSESAFIRWTNEHW